MEGVTNCTDCTFWHPLPTQTEGECRRHAPSAVILATKEGTHRVDVYWPKTRASEWCGEWKQEDA